MNRSFATLQALGLCLVTSGLTAQGGLPDAEFLGFGNSEATSLSDFDGKLLLVESFAYW